MVAVRWVTMAELPAFFFVAMNVLLLDGPGLTNGKRDNSVWVRGGAKSGVHGEKEGGGYLYTVYTCWRGALCGGGGEGSTPTCV